MFFRKKKPRIKRKVDKIVKGVIIGGAIGSVVGIGLAPKGKKSKKEKKAGKEKRGIFRVIGRGLKVLFTGKK